MFRGLGCRVQVRMILETRAPVSFELDDLAYLWHRCSNAMLLSKKWV